MFGCHTQARASGHGGDHAQADRGDVLQGGERPLRWLGVTERHSSPVPEESGPAPPLAWSVLCGGTCSISYVQGWIAASGVQTAKQFDFERPPALASSICDAFSADPLLKERKEICILPPSRQIKAVCVQRCTATSPRPRTTKRMPDSRSTASKYPRNNSQATNSYGYPSCYARSLVLVY